MRPHAPAARIVEIAVCIACALVGSTHASADADNARVAEKQREGTVLGMFCRVGQNEWRQVLSHDAAGIVLDTKPVTFEDIWTNPETKSEPNAAKETIAWDKPLPAVPDDDVTSWAYALTYHEHRREARLDKSFKFPKGGPAFPTSKPIAYRDNLDYEVEFGVLMQRGRTDRFGYMLVNDLTDRGVQVREYDEKNPVPSFSRSKTFPESLRVGPLLAIGDAAAWKALEATLDVNGEQRQHIHASDCVYDPQRFHSEIFGDTANPEWVLVASGTGGGVVFRQPSLVGKLWLFIRGGFSVNGAKERLLKRLDFLKTGDTVVISSPTLGYAATTVRE